MRVLAAYTAIVERALDELFPVSVVRLPRDGEIPALLQRAMNYSLAAGGKRLRPSMLLAAVDMLGGDVQGALAPACALELIHTYSLIHDDLPCMDDDSMRRGKPANHVAFGEGQAVLAGDGLLTHAFELMGEAALANPKRAARYNGAIYEIARGAGARGMVGGQCMDLFAEREGLSGEELLRYIQINKTSRLFIAAMRAAGRLCGAKQKALDALEAYGLHFGLLFQVTDDLLDALGDAQALGKSTGKDEAHGKLTAVSAYGLDGARQYARTLNKCARGAIEQFGEGARFFVELAEEMLMRTS